MIRSRKLVSLSEGKVKGSKKGTYYVSIMRHYDDGASKRCLSKLIGKISNTEVEEKLEVVSRTPTIYRTSEDKGELLVSRARVMYKKIKTGKRYIKTISAEWIPEEEDFVYTEKDKKCIGEIKPSEVLVRNLEYVEVRMKLDRICSAYKSISDYITKGPKKEFKKGIKNFVLLRYECPGYEKVDIIYKNMDDMDLEKLVDKLEDKTKFTNFPYPNVW